MNFTIFHKSGQAGEGISSPVFPKPDQASQKNSETSSRPRLRLWAALFWLMVWQLASQALGQEILLVSPISVLVRLTSLVRTLPFWEAIGFSLSRISVGFLSAAFIGVLLAALSARFRLVKELLSPFILTIKAIPVASFIILALIWIPSKNLSVFISFLMVFPVIYTNVLDGILSTSQELLEMTQVFALPPGRTIRYIYVSQVLPFFQSACTIGLGLCWKSGIAAEVIGIPDGSIGESLYNAKIFLNTPDLFAWTLVIVIVSLTFETFFLKLLDMGVKRLERM